jgi:chemotaxis protein methyltransferase CheR
MPGLMTLNEKEYQLISKLVYSKFGINLTEKKKTLIRGRLNSLIQSLGLNSFEEYYHHIVDDNSGDGLLDLVDKISTNHTYFFRENDHFLFLKEKILPDILSKFELNSPRDIRIWCAGCASGEEAYTIAMTIAEFFNISDFCDGPIILATDISFSALEQAQKGEYDAAKLKNTDQHLLSKYFDCVNPGSYRIKNILKNLIMFKRLNLIGTSFPFRKRFHLIFCRNVMIYFDNETKKSLTCNLYKNLEKEGNLFLGHAESLGRNTDEFKYIQPALYERI